MDLLREGAVEAWSLLVEGDPDTWFAIGLSLWTTLVALAIGAAVGVPLGAWIGLFRPRGERALAFFFRVGMSTPTVFIGTVLYGLLSWRGPLGSLRLLYTPWAMVIGQALLALPVMVSFAHAATTSLDARAVETVRTHGGGRRLALAIALAQVRPTLVAAGLLAFGRCITELGIALAVGGSLRMSTRTLPALATLETSRGEFGRSLACGLILVLLACGAAAVAIVVEGREKRA
jgi:tungstate transport system permease protein